MLKIENHVLIIFLFLELLFLLFNLNVYILSLIIYYNHLLNIKEIPIQKRMKCFNLIFLIFKYQVLTYKNNFNF